MSIRCLRPSHTIALLFLVGAACSSSDDAKVQPQGDSSVEAGQDAGGDAAEADGKTTQDGSSDAGLGDAVLDSAESDAATDGVSGDGSIDVAADTKTSDALTGCTGSGFSATRRLTTMGEYDGMTYWSHRSVSGSVAPYESLQIFLMEDTGGHTTPGTYKLSAEDASPLTCVNCFAIELECETVLSETVCKRLLVATAGSEFEIRSMGDEPGKSFDVVLRNAEFVEWDLESDPPALKANGANWCIDTTEIKDTIADLSKVDLPRPTGLTCEYPEGPYQLMAPMPGEATPPSGTMPPLAWPGAFHDGEAVGFDLAKYRCEHPEVKTLIIMASAGWCSACEDYYPNEICNAGGIADQLKPLGAEILFVVGDTAQPGSPATNDYANTRIDYYGCTSGYRVSDVDSNAPFRSIWSNPMMGFIPWRAAIRMSDMKVTHRDTTDVQFDAVAVATENAK